MKRVALLTIFFYVCTFASPQRVHAALPLAAIGVAAVGAACVVTSGGTGQFYTKTGVTPAYVPSTTNAGASAKDYMFLPGYLAVGAYNIVTKTTFPMAEKLFLAKTAAIGASIGTIIDTVQSSASDAYSALKSLLNQNKTGGVFDSSIASSMPSGSVVQLSNGSKIKFFGPTRTSGMDPPWVTQQYASATYKFPVVGGGCFTTVVNGVGEWMCFNGSLYGTWMTKVWFYNGTSTTDQPTLTPPPYGVNYDGLKTSLSNPSSQVASEVNDILSKTAPPAAVTAGSVPSTVAGATAAPTLTQAEVNNWFKANTAEVAQAAADAAVAAAAADPTNAQLAQAAADAATAAAQAAADAADPDVEDYTAELPELSHIELKTIDFTPITSLTSEASRVFPFGLIGSIADSLSPLSSPSPVAPRFDIDLGLVQREISLVPFDNFAQTFRSICSFFFWCLTLFSCFKLYSRM